MFTFSRLLQSAYKPWVITLSATWCWHWPQVVDYHFATTKLFENLYLNIAFCCSLYYVIITVDSLGWWLGHIELFCRDLDIEILKKNMSCLYSCLITSLERVALAIIFDVSSQHGCFREQVVLELLVDLVDFNKITALFAFAHTIPTFLCSVLTGRGDSYHLLSPACQPLY